MRKAYQSDLSDAEWSCLEPYLPAPKAYGRPRLHSPHEILDAILYVLKSGCAWRLLPHDFPPWRTVYHYFRAWRLSGPLGKDALRTARAGEGATREEPPAQRRDSGFPVGEDHGRGRRRTRLLSRGQEDQGQSKRHLLVDTQGLVLIARVHRANVTDRDGIKLLLEPARTSFLARLSHLWLDAGYTGQDRGAGWVQKTLGWSAEIVKHPPEAGTGGGDDAMG